MFTVAQSTTVLTQLFIMVMVNVTIELVGKLEVRGNMTELEINLELTKSFHMIYKLRILFFPRVKKIELFFTF